jgi:hypothetical protein
VVRAAEGAAVPVAGLVPAKRKKEIRAAVRTKNHLHGCAAW